MKGHVSKRGSSWAYWFDIDPDPLTGRRRQQTRSGYASDKEAWKACREAMADYEDGSPRQGVSAQGGRCHSRMARPD